MYSRLLIALRRPKYRRVRSPDQDAASAVSGGLIDFRSASAQNGLTREERITELVLDEENWVSDRPIGLEKFPVARAA